MSGVCARDSRSWEYGVWRLAKILPQQNPRAPEIARKLFNLRTVGALFYKRSPEMIPNSALSGLVPALTEFRRSLPASVFARPTCPGSLPASILARATYRRSLPAPVFAPTTYRRSLRASVFARPTYRGSLPSSVLARATYQRSLPATDFAPKTCRRSLPAMDFGAKMGIGSVTSIFSTCC